MNRQSAERDNIGNSRSDVSKRTSRRILSVLKRDPVASIPSPLSPIANVNANSLPLAQ